MSEMTPPPAPEAGGHTTVHLLRHGQVDNPRGVLYGCLPGYHLSGEGVVMAKAAASFLAGRDVTLLASSPLERAQETAVPLAVQFGLDVTSDDKLIEPWNHFEGQTFGVGDGALWRPSHWWSLRDPFRPSWGEPYASLAARMRAAMDDAARRAHGHEAVLVSHQLPIWVARLSVAGRRLWHHPGRRQCALASLTSFTYTDGRITAVSYAEPAGDSPSHAHGA